MLSESYSKIDHGLTFFKHICDSTRQKVPVALGLPAKFVSVSTSYVALLNTVKHHFMAKSKSLNWWNRIKRTHKAYKVVY